MRVNVKTQQDSIVCYSVLCIYINDLYNMIITTVN